MRVKLSQRQFNEVIYQARHLAAHHHNPGMRKLWSDVTRNLYLAARVEKQRQKAAAVPVACGGV